MKVAAILLLAGGLEGEVCINDPRVIECPQGFSYPVDWIGYSTEGDPCFQHFGEDWVPMALTLSSSSIDPYANEGEIPGDGRLYLWILRLLEPFRTSAAYGGWGTVYVTFTGDIDILSYQQVAPFGFYWDAEKQNLLFDLECIHEDQVQEEIVGILSTDSTVSLEVQSWSRVKALYR